MSWRTAWRRPELRRSITGFRRRRVGLVTTAIVVVAAALAGWWTPRGSTPRPVSAPTTTTAPVVRTDLATTEQVNGVLGYAGSYTVINPIGATAAQRGQAQTQVAQLGAQLTAAESAVTDVDNQWSTQIAADQAAADQAAAIVHGDATQLSADQAQVAADQRQQASACAGSGAGSTACSAATTSLAADSRTVAQDRSSLAHDQQALLTAQGKVTSDRSQRTSQVNSARGQVAQLQAQIAALDASGQATAPVSITWVPTVGDVIPAGGRVYELDGRRVTLFVGATAILRPLRLGVPDGPDVAILKSNLAKLGADPGHRMHPDGHFDQATADAVRRWQAGAGITPADGAVRPGDIVVLPTPLRVTGVSAAAGGQAQPGATVLTGTSTSPVVTVALPPAKEYLVHVGDQVMVDLPDGTTTAPGQITTIATVATGTPSGGATNPPTSQQQGQQQLAQNTALTVTITLSRPQVTVLDQAPVQVDITDQQAKGVLAVPVEALLAPPSGGYAVAVREPDDSRRVVPVHIGLITSSLVQISGPGIVAGTRVEVPAS